MRYSKQEIYRMLCVESGTYPIGAGMTPDEWYAECSHNIGADLDAALELAAGGDVDALAAARAMMGLCPLC